MNIIDIAVKRPVTSIMFFLVAIIIGVISILGLQVQLMPSFNIDFLSIQVAVKDQTPSTVEEEVTSIIFEGAKAVKGVDSVTSSTSANSAFISINLSKNANKKDVIDGLNKMISEQAPRLPSWAERPVVQDFDMNDMPFYYLVISGADVLTNKYALESDIKPALEKIPGITKVTLNGMQEYKVDIKLDPFKVGRYGANMSDVYQAIKAHQSETNLGLLKTSEGSLTLKSKKEIKSIDQIEGLVLSLGSSKVMLNEIADITISKTSDRSQSFYNGQASINMAITKAKTANTSSVGKAVDETLAGLKVKYPTYDFITTSNDADQINKSVDSVVKAGLIGGFFAILVLYLFMRNIMSTIIIAVSIPVSLLISMIFIKLSGTSINVISLGGLSLGVGMLVDNSIVVIENIFRHTSEGKKVKLASVIGVKEVVMAIFASTLTTIAIFLPTLFAKGLAASLFKDLAVTVIATLATSLFVAVTLVPMMASRLLKADKLKTKPLFFIDKYKTVLKWCLHHRKTVVISVIVLFIGALALIPIIGIEMMPQNEERNFTISASVIEGEDIQIQPIVMSINQALDSQADAIKAISYDINFERGSAYYNVAFEDHVKDTKAVVNSLRDLLRGQFVGISLEVGRGDYFGGDYKASMPIRLQGKDFIKLMALKSDLEKELVKLPNIKGLASKTESKNKEIQVDFDQDKLVFLGLTEAEIARQISLVSRDQMHLMSLELAGDSIDVSLKQDKDPIKSLETFTLILPTGGYVLLSELASFREIDLPESIRREGKFYTTSIQLEPLDYMMANSESQTFLAGYGFETGYGLVEDKAASDTRETMINMAIIFGMAILLVFVVLASQFESFKIPLIIMGTVPLALIGVVLGHMIFMTKIGTLSLMGIIMLAGMIVNGAIVLVDYIRQLRASGLSLEVAIVEGSMTRVRPILMTALTTILAMLPMALNIGESTKMMAPMAVAVVGGMVFGTVLTLIVIPVIYMASERKKALKQVATTNTSQEVV